MPDPDEPTRIHYIHRLSAGVQQRIVGIFVLSAVLVLVGIILLQLHSSHLLDDRIEYHAYLANAQGVSTETLINISGIEVGQVSAITITDDNRIHVQFFVYEGFQRLLRSDSTGALNKLSLIGNAVIMIRAGSSELPILPAGSQVPIEEPVTVEDLIATLTPVISTLNKTVQRVSEIIEVIEPEQIKSTAADMTNLMQNVLQVSQQVSEGRGLAGKILYDAQLEQDFSTALHDIGPIIQDSGKLAKQTLQSMRQVDRILNETEQRLQQIAQLIEPATRLVNQSNEVALEVHAITRQVNNEIHQLPTMINKMQNLLDTTQQTIHNAGQIWPLSTVIQPGSTQTQINGPALDD